MVKMFPNMPLVLEEYNPEDIFVEYTQPSETFDKNGLLHSYNDVPSTVEIELSGYKILVWHVHGKIYRKDNPAYLMLSSDSFRSFNQEYELHSFHGMPSVINFVQDEVDLKWHDNGTIHRGEDLPAMITADSKEIIEYEYCEQGINHRAGNKPSSLADFINSWSVKGWQHNAESYSSIELAGRELDGKEPYKTWHLYDIRLKEETFNTIKAFELEKQAPLWVAFLYELDVIHDDELKLFLNESNVWNNMFPITWVLKSWGITAEVYRERIMDLYFHDGRITNNQSYFSLEPVLEIADFERSRV